MTMKLTIYVSIVCVIVKLTKEHPIICQKHNDYTFSSCKNGRNPLLPPPARIIEASLFMDKSILVNNS